MGTVDLVIGVDIGQKRDPTAVAVAELSEDAPPTFMIRFLERLPLQTPYQDVAERVATTAPGAPQQRYKPATASRIDGRSFFTAPAETVSLRLVTDITGVGQPVHELFERAITATNLAAVGVHHPKLVPATFTHGDRLSPAERGGKSVGKAYLVARLQALLQTSRIRLPRTREAAALAQELLDYEIKVDEHANDKYGAFRVGAHDDLVTALGLACLEDWRSVPSRQYGGYGPAMTRPAANGGRIRAGVGQRPVARRW